MAIITFTTDWKKSDFYAGAIKGQILKSLPNAQLIDISHQIKAFSVSEAAFILNATFVHFPANTIHIAAIQTMNHKEPRYLVVRANEQYFISSDNGIFSLMEQLKPEFVIEIYPDLIKDIPYPSFPELGLYAPLASYIALGKDICQLGKKTMFDKHVPLKAYVESNKIIGGITYIDSYGNALVNINRELFAETGRKRKFEINIKGFERIRKINKNYNENTPGDLFAIFNSRQQLEIGMFFGDFASVFNMTLNSPIIVEFMDS